MGKKFAKFLCVIASVVLIIGILFTCIEIKAFNMNFYKSEYANLDTARKINMNQTELLDVTKYLLDYIKGDKDNLRIKAVVDGREDYVFNKRERQHMVDVRELYLFWKSMRDAAMLVVVAVMLLTIIIAKKQTTKIFSKSFLIGESIIAILGVILGGWIMLDFNSFWTNFHYLFFTNDLWLLDPDTDIMINMFTEQFFYDMSTSIGTLFIIVCLILSGAAIGYLIYSRNRAAAPMKVKIDNKKSGKTR